MPIESVLTHALQQQFWRLLFERFGKHNMFEMQTLLRDPMPHWPLSDAIAGKDGNH